MVMFHKKARVVIKSTGLGPERTGFKSWLKCTDLSPESWVPSDTSVTWHHIMSPPEVASEALQGLERHFQWPTRHWMLPPRSHEALDGIYRSSRGTRGPVQGLAGPCKWRPRSVGPPMSFSVPCKEPEVVSEALQSWGHCFQGPLGLRQDPEVTPTAPQQKFCGGPGLPGVGASDPSPSSA